MFKKWKKRIKRLRLDEKLRLYFTTVIIGMTVAMLLVITFFSIGTQRQMAESMAMDQTSFVAKSYADWMDIYKNSGMALQMDPSVQRFCSFESEDAADYTATKSYVSLAVANSLNSFSSVNFIGVYNTALNSYVYSGNVGIPYSGFEAIYEKGTKQYRESGAKGTYVMRYGDSDVGILKNTISFYQKIYSVSVLNKEIGMLCLNVKDSLLANMRESITGNSMILCAAGSDGRILSSTDEATLSDADILFSFDGKQSGDFRYGANVCFFYKVSGWDYYIVSMIPAIEFYKSAIITLTVMAALMLLIMFLSILFSRTIARKNYEPIEKVMAAMDKIGENDLSVRVNTSDMGVDFEKLGVGFNGMMDDINQLMIKNREEQHQLDQIRFNSLQSQIQPHFLYNTLDCIHWQASADGNKEVSDLIVALAAYYRICLSNGKDIIPLSVELEQIRYYLIIQNKRYGDIIHYENKVDEKYLGVLLPKLTLQPLVENSIYHGIRVKEGGSGSVTVDAHEEGRDLVIEVSDSGREMTADSIRKMNESISDYSENFGYGVRNVSRRLKLLYGEAYGLHFKLIQDGSLCVEIRIPGKEENTAAEGAGNV